MKKKLYLCNCDLEIKNGHGQMIRMHHKMLNQLYPNCVITVMVSDNLSNNGYYCLPHPSQAEKVLAVLKGYTPDLSLNSIRFVLSLIDKEEIDTVFLECSILGNLIQQIKKRNSSVTVISYFTDIEADFFKQEMAHSGFKRKFVCKRIIENEKKTVKYADKTFVLNKRDETLYQKIYQQKPDAIIPIIILMPSISEKIGIHYANDTLKLLFVGGDFWPNVAGIRWFIDKVLPKVTVPYKLRIVGLDMEKYRKELEQKSPYIHVVGTVNTLTSYFEDADLFISPVKDGGGMKVKTAEALSYGKIFIGLEESLEGYWEYIPESLKNNGIYMCKKSEDFAKRINSFYDEHFNKCRGDIREFIESICSYENNFKVFKRLFEK